MASKEGVIRWRRAMSARDDGNIVTVTISLGQRVTSGEASGVQHDQRPEDTAAAAVRGKQGCKALTRHNNKRAGPAKKTRRTAMSHVDRNGDGDGGGFPVAALAIVPPAAERRTNCFGAPGSMTSASSQQQPAD